MAVNFFIEKLITLIVLWVITPISAYLPWILCRHFRKSLIIMSFCNCLAGGVVFGAMLMHVLPVVFEEIDEDNPEWIREYPIGALMAGISFLTLFAIDRLFLSHSASDKSCNSLSNHSTADISPPRVEPEKDALHGHHQKFNSDEIIRMQCCERCPLKTCFQQSNIANTELLSDMEKLNSQPITEKSLPFHHLIHPNEPILAAMSPFFTTNDASSTIQSNQAPRPLACSINVKEFSTIVPVKESNEKASRAHAFIFVIALSVHSFLEGIGLSAISDWNKVLSYIIGLISHKWLEAFALGMTIYNAKFSNRMNFILNMFYSSLTPFGILIGMLIMSKTRNNLAEVILTGLSAGSFFFVCCVEMIPPEFAIVNRYSIYKFICVATGFIVMALGAIADISFKSQ